MLWCKSHKCTTKCKVLWKTHKTLQPLLSKRLSKSLAKSCDTFVSQHLNKLKLSQISGDNISKKHVSSQTHNSEIHWVKNIPTRMSPSVLQGSSNKYYTCWNKYNIFNLWNKYYIVTELVLQIRNGISTIHF